MIYREYSPELMTKALCLYRDDIVVNPELWLTEEDNYLLTDGNGNYGLFEGSGHDVYFGHYFFKARGREAVRVANEILSCIFGLYRAEVIKGLTPVEHRGALWMNKTLGFKAYGVTDTTEGPHEIFIMTKKEFENRHG